MLFAPARSNASLQRINASHYYLGPLDAAGDFVVREASSSKRWRAITFSHEPLLFRDGFCNGNVSDSDEDYAWWESVWSAREAASVSSRDSVVSATLEYGPVEVSAGGDYVGYTPVDLELRPVAREGHDETLAAARDALDLRFERWHSAAVDRRFGR